MEKNSKIRCIVCNCILVLGKNYPDFTPVEYGIDMCDSCCEIPDYIPPSQYGKFFELKEKIY